VPASDDLFILTQYLLPKKALTELMGKLAGARAGRTTTRVIEWFIRRYGVNMAEAANPDPAAYASFNDFFTRPLRDDARPLAQAELLCPVDGAISQFGPIEDGQIFQAKGHDYSATTLVGGDQQLAATFRDGLFATLYLSPRDYHRIHMPCDGTLREMIYVPGDLFSVNPLTARRVPGLFARNERVACVFDSPQGPFVMVLVGATVVGSMATVWHDVVNPPRRRDITKWRYEASDVTLKRGAEMGRFLLGSTVVLLFPKDRFAFNAEWTPGRAIRMGEAMSQPLGEDRTAEPTDSNTAAATITPDEA